MPCPHCVAADHLFDARLARRELARLRRWGPRRSTRRLIDALPRGTLLDIGGGVGAIQHAFVDVAPRMTHIDASRAYVQVAEEELRRLGFADSEHRLGDFVDLAEEIDEHDVVALDRVLCCYPDLAALVAASAERAGVAWGVVFPRERWWSRAGSAVVNLYLRIRGSDYQTYIHPEEAVRQHAAAAGLHLESASATWLWNVWVFARQGATGS